MVLIAKNYPNILPSVLLLVAAMSQQSPFTDVQDEIGAVNNQLVAKEKDMNRLYQENKVGSVEELDPDNPTVQAYLELKDKLEELKRAATTAERSRREWLHKKSDAITILRALTAHAKVPISKQAHFAARTGLITKTVTEIHKLRKQLGRMLRVSDRATGVTPMAYDAVTDLSSKQEKQVMQIVAAGLINQIAKRCTDPKQLQKWIELDMIMPGTVAYISAHEEIGVPFFYHQSSVLSKSSKRRLPEYVCYKEIVLSTGRHSRSQMRCLSEVEPTQIVSLASETPLVRIPEPTAESVPRYDSKKDAIVCTIRPEFGDRRWELPAQTITYPIGLDYYRHFARQLLSGIIIPQFKKYGWRQNIGQVTRFLGKHGGVPDLGYFGPLVEELARAEIHSLNDLEEKWSEDGEFLRNAIHYVVAKSQRSDFAPNSEVWKSIVESVLKFSVTM
eukprot:TRINITY_DN5578_c0_g1_i1.p1 TRINITY_DN5578_c0_g1~~TRINITY_DN5578_c0_g1_i1.p1  ORF type:complete len:472 (-),score=152.78 TRINITY_DN5578_c0_g1_i1:208-1545(-)